MKRPKLELLQYVFGRPEPSGAYGEVVKEYIRHKVDAKAEDPLTEVEQETALAIKDLEAERKDMGLAPLRPQKTAG